SVTAAAARGRSPAKGVRPTTLPFRVSTTEAPGGSEVILTSTVVAAGGGDGAGGGSARTAGRGTSTAAGWVASAGGAAGVEVSLMKAMTNAAPAAAVTATMAAMRPAPPRRGASPRSTSPAVPRRVLMEDEDLDTERPRRWPALLS